MAKNGEKNGKMAKKPVKKLKLGEKKQKNSHYQANL